MAGFDAVARKVSSPPGAQNCTRLNVIGDELATTNKIAKFALAIPPFNYAPALTQCRTCVQLGLDLETAKKAVRQTGAPAGREYNVDLVNSFFLYDEERQYSLQKSVENFNGEYRLSRDVRVPTRPTFTIIENGRLVPITVCGWKSLPLVRDQVRFWMTMLEEGLYSYTDYRRSPAEIVFFLEEDTQQGKVRKPSIIRRGDYTLFTPSEMREQAELYVRAQSAALPIVEAAWKERDQRRKQKEAERVSTDGADGTLYPSPGLFD